MNVRVLVFGLLREYGKDAETVCTLPDKATVTDLLAQMRADSSVPAGLWNSIAVSVNREYATLGTPLTEGDEVALLPPVSGGASNMAEMDEPLIRVSLGYDLIDREALTASTRDGGDGAVCVFDGIVRNHTRGRRTLYLDYEAYDEMALAQMQQLATQAAKDFAVNRVSIHHRLGRLYIGDTSVLIVVSSAHRAAAFDACRWLIDTLKKTVPIWKKEYFEDGVVWAPGEAFPAELAVKPEQA